MGSREELERQLEEQKAQLANYENKLKNVVQAYKSIEAEKKAMEVAFATLSAPVAAPSNESSTSQPTEGAGESSNANRASPEEQLEALRQALATLTVENRKKELAFQSDRKALIQKNDKLAERVERLQAGAGQQSLRKLKEHVKVMEAEREKTLQEHGTMLAEMQQSYAKERVHCEKMEKQVAELSLRLHEKDEAIGRCESRLRELSKLETELQAWKQKAEATPTAKVLREELTNAKAFCDEELRSTKERYEMNTAMLQEKDTRIEYLELRLNELGSQGAELEGENVKLAADLRRVGEELRLMVEENEQLRGVPCGVSKAATNTGEAAGELGTKGDPLVAFQQLYLKLKQINSEFDVHDWLSLERPISGASTPSQSTRDPSEAGSTILCAQCELAREELSHFKTASERLARKLAMLEESLRTKELAHNQKSDALRQRISELESMHVKSQGEAQLGKRIAELEEELSRQRMRMTEVIAEKDTELDAARHNLAAAVRWGESRHVEPSDPQPPGQQRPVKGLAKNSFGSTDEAPLLAAVKRSLSQLSEARNVFYEQELLKRDEEILQLRSVNRMAEYKMRDLEQSVLTKDVQYLQIVETLKEEIRILESRLKLERADTNMAYLRNIFVQFLQSPNPTSRKHILRAIGAVLKLTAQEMRRVEKWNL